MFDMKSYHKEYQENYKERRRELYSINKENINKKRREYRLNKGITKKIRTNKKTNIDIKIDRIEYMRKYKKILKENGIWWLKRGDRGAQSERWRNKPGNNIKKIAHNKVYNAVKNVKLIRPDNCQICGFNEYIQAHHEDYDKPLEVMWLCHNCHNEIHKESEVLTYGR